MQLADPPRRARRLLDQAATGESLIAADGSTRWAAARGSAAKRAAPRDRPSNRVENMVSVYARPRRRHASKRPPMASSKSVPGSGTHSVLTVMKSTVEPLASGAPLL